MNDDNIRNVGERALIEEVVRQYFDDIMGCARSYYYYVVDERTATAYKLNDRYFYGGLEDMINAIRYTIASDCKNSLPLVSCIVEHTTYDFIQNFISRLNRLYPAFTKAFKKELDILLEESKRC